MTAALLAIVLWEWVSTAPQLSTHEKWLLLHAGVLWSSGTVGYVATKVKGSASVWRMGWLRVKRALLLDAERHYQKTE